MTGDNTHMAEKMTTFEVDGGGTLRVAGFVDATRRQDFYPHVATWWDESTENLKQAVCECPPLRWALEKIYRQNTEEDAPDPAGDLKVLNGWLDTVSPQFLQTEILPTLRDWFANPPTASGEEEYLDRSTTTGQGYALSIFEAMEPDALDILGVEIVYGASPGSSYMSAELKHDIDAANTAAAENGIPVRFVKTAPR